MFTKGTSLCKPTRSQLRLYIEACQSNLHSFARTCIPAKLKSQFGASDLVQEACFNAYRHLSSFRGSTYRQFSAWLRTILHNQILNILKRLHYKIDRQAIHQAIPVQLHNLAAFHEETPSHILMDREEQDLMNHALEQLTMEERHLLARHHRDALTFAELGAELQCSEEAARKRWTRALLRWKRLVQSSHA